MISGHSLPAGPQRPKISLSLRSSKKPPILVEDQHHLEKVPQETSLPSLTKAQSQTYSSSKLPVPVQKTKSKQVKDEAAFAKPPPSTPRHDAFAKVHNSKLKTNLTPLASASPLPLYSPSSMVQALALHETKLIRHEDFLSAALHPQRLLAKEIMDALHRSKRCVVVTGAGISVSGGIPDFRSLHGLYGQVRAKYPKAFKTSGQDLFDAGVFQCAEKTKIFYEFMAELKSVVDEAQATPVHHFIRRLADCKKLMRVYTQNIDGLEAQLGMDCDLDSKHVQSVLLHGTLHKVICIVCKSKYDWKDEHGKTFSRGEAPECPRCTDHLEQRLAQGRRSVPVGILRPDIVLYHEPHADGDRIAELAATDMRKRPDMLLVMGTSLKVAGIRHLVKQMAKTVRSNGGRVVLVNKTAISQTQEWKSIFDCTWLGDADQIVAWWNDELCRRETETAMRRQQRRTKENVLDKYQPMIDKAFPVVAHLEVAVSKKKPASPLLGSQTSPVGRRVNTSPKKARGSSRNAQKV